MTDHNEKSLGPCDAMPEEIYVERDLARNSAGFYAAKPDSKWGSEVKYIRADKADELRRQDLSLVEMQGMEIKRLRADLAATSQWRDISTAPRDGSMILVWHKDYHHGAGVSYWSDVYSKFMIGSQSQPTRWHVLNQPNPVCQDVAAKYQYLLKHAPAGDEK